MTPSIVDQLDNFIAAIEKSLSEDVNLMSLIGCDEDILVSADFGMDLEIAFRQYMERLLISEKVMKNLMKNALIKVNNVCDFFLFEFSLERSSQFVRFEVYNLFS